MLSELPTTRLQTSIYSQGRCALERSNWRVCGLACELALIAKGPMPTRSNKRKEILTLAFVFAGVLLISAFAVYLVGGRGGTPATTTSGQVEEPTTPGREPVERRSPAPEPSSQTFIDELFGHQTSDVCQGGERWAVTMGRIS